jgi:hypothetical protein
MPAARATEHKAKSVVGTVAGVQRMHALGQGVETGMPAAAKSARMDT